MAAAEALGSRGAVRPLIGALSHPCGFTSRAAAKALRKMGWTPTSDNECLLLAVAERDTDKVTAIAARHADLATPLLDHYDASMRKAAALALGPPRQPEALTALSRLLGDPSEENRRTVVVLLRDCGLPQVAIHLIQVAQSDPSRFVRSLAVESLARIQLNEAHAAPIAVLLADPSTRSSATVALCRLGQSGADAAISTPQSDEPSHRWSVAEVLSRVRDPRAESALLGILADPTCTGFKESVLNALGTLPSLTSVTPLLQALHHKDPNVVCAAALAVAKQGDRSCIQHLRAVAGQYPDWVWECLTEAIQRLEKDGGVEQGDEADAR